LDGYGSAVSQPGRLPGIFYDQLAQCGNDCEGVGRLIESEGSRRQFSRNAYPKFSLYPTQLGRRYGLANQVFLIPTSYSLSGGAYALHPYYRERRLIGLSTARADILPFLAVRLLRYKLMLVECIALGNYANHYPGVNFLSSKNPSAGRTLDGNPIPYGCLPRWMVYWFVKNISVSHIANGATRLQPVVMVMVRQPGWQRRYA